MNISEEIIETEDLFENDEIVIIKARVFNPKTKTGYTEISAGIKDVEDDINELITLTKTYDL